MRLTSILKIRPIGSLPQDDDDIVWLCLELNNCIKHFFNGSTKQPRS